MGLLLKRDPGEAVVINVGSDRIRIVVGHDRRGAISLYFEAERHVRIMREELEAQHAVRKENTRVNETTCRREGSERETETETGVRHRNLAAYLQKHSAEGPDGI